MISRQFMLFVLAGGIAAAANFLSRIALGMVMPYVPSIVLAYGIGMLTAFLLNRAFVFTGASNSMRSQVGWFVAVNLLAVAQTVLISLFLARWLFPRFGFDWHPETVAHAIGVAVPVFTSFIGHRLLTFRGADRA
ncbi:GtrA family protein [Arenimonas sp. MALMAid1274]|uniref:GtrA family protein n=1 Tax=Arenimonas sp. MALMAid1274 TaxID=3411630 RepID=UPI003BA1F3EF